MGILGIGVDIVHVPRITGLTKRRGIVRFAQRVLSTEEMHSLPPKLADCLHFLAVRWSIKEAAYKAMYPTARPTWKELTYRGYNAESCQKPSLVYCPLSQNVAKIGQIFVSVSHDGDYVFSQVVVEEQSPLRI